MYYCKDCDGFFEKPDENIERHGFTVPPYETFYVCPYCGSEDYDVTLKCSQCGVYIDDDYIKLADGDCVCSNCYIIKKF